MGDDMQESERRDDTRINVDQPHELKYWSEKFGVTEEKIRQAVKTAGPTVTNVRHQLAASRSY